MKTLIDETVVKHFSNIYLEGDISKGKNLIVFEIAKRYISNFLPHDRQDQWQHDHEHEREHGDTFNMWLMWEGRR